MQFVASKFEPETDPDRPIVGSEIAVDGDIWVVRHVLSELVSVFLKSEIDLRGCAASFSRPHATRPAVIWTCLCDKAPL